MSENLQSLMPLLLIAFSTSGHTAACIFLYSSRHSGFNFIIWATLFPWFNVLLSRSDGLHEVTEDDDGEEGAESRADSDERWVCVFLLDEKERRLEPGTVEVGEAQLSQLVCGAVQRPWLERSVLRASAGK